MASPTELEEWCRASCAGYSSVEVRDWSRSFQSGLAFCAIIHKHRPELIDFSSLSKDNAYQNNKMALELAETKLGVFMLLDPGEMASAPEPDGLAVITCVFQFYFLFNRKSIGTSVYYFHLLCKSKASFKRSCFIAACFAAGLRHNTLFQSLTHLESTGKYFSSDTKPRVSCDLCFEPVHLIQRRVVDGKVYHRKCFRCRHCHLSLLPGAYTKGNSANSMICSHHVQPHSENSKQTDTCSYLSLSGLAISSVPHYPVKKEPPDEQVCKKSEVCCSVGLYGAVKITSPQWRTSVDGENGGSSEKREAGIAPEDGENILGGDPERGRGAVPAPRRSVTSYGTSSSPNMSDPRTQGKQCHMETYFCCW
uniref:Uncharacterized protein n=1 Tax=Periophthalmus magnuspinnatus TaxID=409849 RepID=A0A3B4AXG7_9GOBI